MSRKLLRKPPRGRLTPRLPLQGRLSTHIQASERERVMSTEVTLFWTSGMTGELSPSGRSRLNETHPFSELVDGFGHRRKDPKEKGKTSLPCVHNAPVCGVPNGASLPSTGGRPPKFLLGPPEVVMLDLDNKEGGLTWDTAKQISLALRGTEHAVWETASSTEGSTRLRVAVPLAEGLRRSGARYYEALGRCLAEAAGIDVTLVDPVSFRPSQVMALPAKVNLDGRTPLILYLDGDPFAPSSAAVERHMPALRASSPGRGLDSMTPEERRFNERYGPGGEGLEALPDNLVQLMGCRYVREGDHWRWESLGGEQAAQAGVHTSYEDGAYVDEYGSSPLSGRVAFALDFVVHQAALHSFGWDSLDDDRYAHARAQFADPVLREEREVERKAFFEEVPHRKDASGNPDPYVQYDKYSLAEAAYFKAPTKTSKGGETFQNVERVTRVAYAPRLEPYCRALRSVFMTATGVPVRRRGGALKPLVSQEAETLRAEMLRELCPPEDSQKPGITIPSDPSNRFFDAMIQARLRRDEAQLPDERSEALDRCKAEWVAAGSPTPRDLFPCVPGFLPQGGAEDYYWAVFERLWLLVVHRVRRPGSRLGNVIPFLTGGQNAGKNELALALAGGRISWFPRNMVLVTDDSVMSYTKDQTAAQNVLEASTRMVVLMDEVQGLGNRESSSSRLKMFATMDTYAVTPKYLGTTSIPRSFLTMAAANNALQGLVPADEGYRRYMVVPMVSHKDASASEAAAQAYRELSRLVSPTSPEAEYLNTMLLGWATSLVDAAVAQGSVSSVDAEYRLLDDDFSLGGRWADNALRDLVPIFSHKDILANLLAQEPEDGLVSVRDVLGQRVGTTARAAVKFWVELALKGQVDPLGEFASIDPGELAAWQANLLPGGRVKRLREGPLMG